MDIDIALAQLEGLVLFFKSYRETGFQAAKVEAERIAIDMEIDHVFSMKAKRLNKRKRYHDDEPEKVGQHVILTAEENFRVNYFIKIVDQCLVSLGTRFDQLQNYEKTFGFLFDLKKLKLADNDKLMTSCANLEVFLKHGNHSDLDDNDLFLELKLLRGVLPKDIKKVVEILDFLEKDGKLLSKYMDYIPHNDDDLRFSCLRRKKFFKVKAHKVLSTVDYLTGKIEWIVDVVD